MKFKGACSRLSRDNLAQFSRAAAMDIRVGTAGWSYKDWEGIVYPANLARRRQHPLEWIASCFDIVEVNTSFYGHIRPELAKLWIHKTTAVNPQFTFTAKLHRSFTHSPFAETEPTSAASIRTNTEDEVRAREGLDALASAGKLGALLIQFPASFKNTSLNREYMEWLLREFIEYPRVVEVRHASWNSEETLASFARHQVGFCNIDQPLLGRALPPTQHVTSAVGYVRLHGRNYDQWFEAERGEDRYNYLYNERELGGWKAKIEAISQSAATTYVVANNHFEGKAAVNALQLKHMLGATSLRAPETLLRRYPELKRIASPLDEDFSGPRLPLLA
jgi:uncharacterized protein YecE (DUF72 family)